MLKGMRMLLGSVSALSLLAAGCKDDDCSDELKIALELHIGVPDGVTISKVTADLEQEEQCTSFRPDKTSDELVYTCYEQGGQGGGYLVRVYDGDQVIHEETVEVMADGCHAQLTTVYTSVAPR
jgi:hypothetical protein